MSALIPASLMRSLTALDERAMPAKATVHHREKLASTPRGGSGFGEWKDRNVEPVKCRIGAAGTAGRETVIGGRMSSLSDVEIAIPLGLIVTDEDDNEGPLTVDSDDEITVCVELDTPRGIFTECTRYKVVGDPGPGAYSTNLTVSAIKVS